MNAVQRSGIRLWALGAVAALAASGGGVVVGLVAASVVLWTWIAFHLAGPARDVVPFASVVAAIALVAWLRSGGQLGA